MLSRYEHKFVRTYYTGCSGWGGDGMNLWVGVDVLMNVCALEWCRDINVGGCNIMCCWLNCRSVVLSISIKVTKMKFGRTTDKTLNLFSLPPWNGSWVGRPRQGSHRYRCAYYLGWLVLNQIRWLIHGNSTKSTHLLCCGVLKWPSNDLNKDKTMSIGSALI